MYGYLSHAGIVDAPCGGFAVTATPARPPERLLALSHRLLDVLGLDAVLSGLLEIQSYKRRN